MSATNSIRDQRIDAQVAEWLREGPDQGSALGLERLLTATHGVNQRPRVVFVGSWLPRSAGDIQFARPHLGGVPILIILGLLLILAMTTIYIGTRPQLPESLGPSRHSLVAFEREGHVYAARVDGSGQRDISGGLPGTSPVFSPDGSKVAFVSTNNGVGGGNSLYVVSVDGSAAPIEVAHGVSVLVNGAPQVSWSPDGTAIAFAGEASRLNPREPDLPRGASIFAALADGSGVEQLTDDRMNRDLPSWSTSWDGERIAYRATELDGRTVRLEYMRPDGSDVKQITLMPTADASLSAVDWSPANGIQTIRISYTVGFGLGTPTQAMIAWLETGTAANSNVAPWTDGVGGLEGYAPAWSPDGQSTAFITASDGVVIAANIVGTGTIYNTAYEGELIHLGDVARDWVDWSPDGTALYGGSPDGSGTVVIPLEDPESAFVTYTPMSGVTSWQPLRP